VNDRVGLGWRPALAAGILTHLDRIDVVEVVADDYLRAPKAGRRALRTLAAQVPVHLHSVGLGLASAAAVETGRLDALGRLVGDVLPERWSEHLAFVRGGGIEIGHLAAPPRNAATVEGAARNLARARAIVGTAPAVENVATLIAPPASSMDEAEWIASILSTCDSDLLLDLHNLHCNASNFGFDASAFLDRIPAERIAVVHLAGGRPVALDACAVPRAPRADEKRRRLLDDHLHDVPEPVYALLADVAARAPRALTVLLERDGAYPPIDHLLGELDRARAALAQGRRRARAAHPGRGTRDDARGDPPAGLSTSPRLEAFLAGILVREEARLDFLCRPDDALAAAGLDARERRALQDIDRAGLVLAAASFAAKRRRRMVKKKRTVRRLASPREIARWCIAACKSAKRAALDRAVRGGKSVAGS
jgi:hypothetical protein